MISKPEEVVLPPVFSHILHKEGINHKVVSFSQGTDYTQTLGIILVQGDSLTTNRLSGESRPRHVVLLLDLKGEKVIGGAIAPWYAGRVAFSEEYGLNCYSEDSLYSAKASFRSLLDWDIWGEEPGLKLNLNKSKPQVEFNSYDKFIRRFVLLVDLHSSLHSLESSDSLYGDYMQRISSIKIELEGEIKSVLSNYPQEFICWGN